MRIVFLLFFLLPAGVYAQSISHSSFVSAVGEYSGQGIQLTYSFGEPVVGYVVRSGAALSQGFQQDPAIILDVDKLPLPDQLYLSVYPNPTRNTITVKLPKHTSAYIHLVDMLGRERAVYEYGRDLPRIRISLQGLGPGIYILHVNSWANHKAASRLLELQP